MAIQGSPTFGPITNIVETLAAGGSSSAAITAPALLPGGTSGGNARSLNTAAAGTPTSCTVKIDGVLTLVGTTPQTVDLRAFTGPNGVTKTLSVLRGYHVENENAADSSPVANYSITMSGPTTNGQLFGGKLDNTGYPIAPASFDCGGNMNTAGYVVDATHKLVTFTAGSAGGTLRFCFWGD